MTTCHCQGSAREIRERRAGAIPRRATDPSCRRRPTPLVLPRGEPTFQKNANPCPRTPPPDTLGPTDQMLAMHLESSQSLGMKTLPLALNAAAVEYVGRHIEKSYADRRAKKASGIPPAPEDKVLAKIVRTLERQLMLVRHLRIESPLQEFRCAAITTTNDHDHHQQQRHTTTSNATRRSQMS